MQRMLIRTKVIINSVEKKTQREISFFTYMTDFYNYEKNFSISFITYYLSLSVCT